MKTTHSRSKGCRTRYPSSLTTSTFQFLIPKRVLLRTQRVVIWYCFTLLLEWAPLDTPSFLSLLIPSTVIPGWTSVTKLFTLSVGFESNAPPLGPICCGLRGGRGVFFFRRATHGGLHKFFFFSCCFNITCFGEGTPALGFSQGKPVLLKMYLQFKTGHNVKKLQWNFRLSILLVWGWFSSGCSSSGIIPTTSSWTDWDLPRFLGPFQSLDHCNWSSFHKNPQLFQSHMPIISTLFSVSRRRVCVSRLVFITEICNFYQ